MPLTPCITCGKLGTGSYCKRHDPAPRRHRFEEMELDHRVAVFRGGEHSYSNVRPAHRRCNLAKG